MLRYLTIYCIEISQILASEFGKFVLRYFSFIALEFDSLLLQNLHNSYFGNRPIFALKLESLCLEIDKKLSSIIDKFMLRK